MKRNIQILMMAVLGLGLMTCCQEELPPYIDFTPEVVDTSLTDTTYVEGIPAAPQEKNVLIEDFTGVRCPNCPFAQEKAATIVAENPGRVFVMGLHPTGVGVLTAPLDESKYDFRLEAAGNIFSFLGGFSGLPAGAVDRLKYPSESYTLVDDDKWKNYTEQRLKVATPVNLILETEFDAAKNEVVITTELHYTQAVAEEHFISIAILESHLIDWQEKTGAGYVEDYEHNHVLREMLTAPSGKKLSVPLEKGRVIIKQYRVKINPGFMADNLDIIAFVHKGGSSYEVLQVQEKAVKE